MHYAIPITQRLKKLIKSLHTKPFRDENGLFVAEGEKLAEELLKSDYTTELIIVRESSAHNVINIADQFAEKGVPVYVAPKHQFDQICDTKTPQGIISVVNLKDPEPVSGESFIVLDAISDPGNVGTIIRTADWFGIKQIVLGKESADAFNPKSVRASMGSIFRISIFYTEDLPAYLNDNYKKIKLYGADINATETIDKMKLKAPFGLVFGSEAHGISPEITGMLSNSYKIDGHGEAESLNVGVAVGIALHHFCK